MGKQPPVLIYEYVEHLTECAGRGRGDEHCSCGAVNRLDDIERAWALLWSVQTSDRAVQNARRLLSEMIDQDGRRRGIGALKPHEMPAGPTAEMMAPDFDAARSEAQPSGYDGSKSLGERLYAVISGELGSLAWPDLTDYQRTAWEKAAVTFTASLSGGEGEGKACAGPARERRGDPSPAQPADALRPGEPEDHLSQLSRIFGRKVTRFKVPGRVDGIQRMEVGFADGDSITTTGADVDSAWRALLAEAETATPDPSNTQAQKMEEG